VGEGITRGKKWTSRGISSVLGGWFGAFWEGVV